MGAPLNIAFLSYYDPLDRRPWSGTINAIYKAVQKWGEVNWIGPIPKSRFIGKACNTASKILFHKKYDYQHSIMYSLNYGRIFNKNLKKRKYDLIVAPAASAEMAFLKTDVPIVYVIDVTFAIVNEYYEVYSNILGLSLKEANLIERSALKKASVILSSSDWAKQSIIEQYGIDGSKVDVVPFGANTENIPDTAFVSKKQKSSQCKILFLGVEWERKGGIIAFDTLLHLERMGLNAELTVCGCVPPPYFKHERMRVIPFLNKTDPKQHAQWCELLRDTDFLLLPTRAEGFGIVFCEANAYGIPAITTETGGIPSVITNNVNGFMLPLSATGEDFAKVIFEIYFDDNRYKKMSWTSRETYEKKLNWDIWSQISRKIVGEKLSI
jgi:glycosyltransferase involved in cell wall biosynthesis